MCTCWLAGWLHAWQGHFIPPAKFARTHVSAEQRPPYCIIFPPKTKSDRYMHAPVLQRAQIFRLYFVPLDVFRIHRITRYLITDSSDSSITKIQIMYFRVQQIQKTTQNGRMDGAEWAVFSEVSSGEINQPASWWPNLLLPLLLPTTTTTTTNVTVVYPQAIFISLTCLMQRLKILDIKNGSFIAIFKTRQTSLTHSTRIHMLFRVRYFLDLLSQTICIIV